VIDEALVIAWLAATVRVATPLLLAALGETLVERGGVINLSIEGAMLAGALASALGATAGGPWAGSFAAIAAGILVAGLFAAVAIGARAEQIITGTAVTLLCVGLTGTIYRQAYGAGGVGLSLPTYGTLEIPVLSGLPLMGAAFFQQTIVTYLGYLLVPLVWWVLFRTKWGLRLRAVGGSTDYADYADYTHGMVAAAGVRARAIRMQAVLIGGALAGLAGAALVLGQTGTFAEKMTAGRGFMAIAIVVLGRYHPVRVLLASLLFGAAMALQFVLQSRATGVPYQLFLMLPYLLTLLVLLLSSQQTRRESA
jgi:simple sugar transport system permease protein